jgi:hypothetical protein
MNIPLGVIHQQTTYVFNKYTSNNIMEIKYSEPNLKDKFSLKLKPGVFPEFT